MKTITRKGFEVEILDAKTSEVLDTIECTTGEEAKRVMDEAEADGFDWAVSSYMIVGC